MSSEWTREHDRVIAEKAEGRQVLEGNPNWPEGGFDGIMTNPCSLYHVAYSEGGQCPVAIRNYSTDIVAVVRAAEAWRNQKPHGVLSWTVGGGDCEGGPYYASLGIRDSYDEWWRKEGATSPDSPAAALAWALWKAVTG